MPNRPIHALTSTPAGTAYSLYKSNNESGLARFLESTGRHPGWLRRRDLARLDRPAATSLPSFVSAGAGTGGDGRCLLVSEFRRSSSLRLYHAPLLAIRVLR